MKAKLVGVGVAVAAALFALAPLAFGRGGIPRPHLLRPQRGASWSLPTFAWTSVRRADHYEFQLAADSHFNSPVLGGDGSFTTRNTRATIHKTPPNGRYWYRVRAVTRNGQVSGWATGSVRKSWRVPPELVSPANGASITYPTDPLILSWKPIAGASRYRVAIATEPTFTTLVGGGPLETSATSVNPPSSLELGTYYWRVTPLDPERNEGASSAVRSFTWRWPTTTNTAVRDLVDAPEFFDPQLSWDPVPGAARYELDINLSVDFAPGSRVCCSSTTTATKYSPPNLLDNATYYWRVRAIDVHGNQGGWIVGPQFTKTFDNVPPVPAPSIKNMHVRSADADPGAYVPGYSTGSPILVWSPVPGASAYEVFVTMLSGGSCDWAHPPFHAITAIPEWTPFGHGPGPAPYPTGGVGIESDPVALTPGAHYCARVRALSDSGPHGRIYGDFTYLDDAFTFTSYDPGGPATPTISASDYFSPPTSPPEGSTPLFTWRPIPGAASYWVLISRDPSFTTLVDYGFTQIAAYAPRISYADETTHYYWAILPSGAANGSSYVASDPHQTAIVPFDKQSAPPSLIGPPAGAVIGAQQPTFQWTPVVGARKYTLQVASDPTFGSSLLDNVTTDSTAYTSNTTYPPDATLYWRVRANDEDGIGLTWSAAGAFTHTLPAPELLGSDTAGDEIPIWRWKSLPGTVEYDIHVVLPDGSTRDADHLPSPACVASLIAGNGFFRWSVRGEFPRSGGTTPGPYSGSQTFTKTLTPPLHPHAIRGRRSLVFAWTAKTTARKYRFQIARNQDFSKIVDSTDTEANVYAPLMTQGDYFKGGKFYWRVAGIDDHGNVGKFTKSVILRLPRRAH